MVVYLVRSFRTYARIRSLTTGTFNLVVKDRIAFRLSGAPSGLDGPAARANPAVLETLQTYSWRKTLSIHASHSISTRFPHWERRLGCAAGERKKSWVLAEERPYQSRVSLPFDQGLLAPAWTLSAQQYGLPLRTHKRRYSGARRSGRQKIEKRSYVWRSLL